MSVHGSVAPMSLHNVICQIPFQKHVSMTLQLPVRTHTSTIQNKDESNTQVIKVHNHSSGQSITVTCALVTCICNNPDKPDYFQKSFFTKLKYFKSGKICNSPNKYGRSLFTKEKKGTH